MANADLIKKLRENTGCGIADCNNALKESKDNYEAAVEWLRKKGLSTAAKKSAKVVSEGVVGIINNEAAAAIIEVNSETDFVARNEKFQNFVKDILNLSLKINEADEARYVEMLKFTRLNDNESVADVLTQNIAIIGENMKIRRGKTFTQANGAIVSYVHGAIVEGLGKIGVLVNLKSDATKENLNELGKGIAMHIAAMKPDYLSEKDVPATKLESEKEIARELAKKSGKPANIIEKMVEGRVKKFYDETVLLKQKYIMDDQKTIDDLLKDFEKDYGKGVEIVEYILYVLGEGIEKQSTDFASEVAQMAGQKV